jgi:hypothetical protein
MNPLEPESETTLAWRVGALEGDLRGERETRHRAFEKLDEQKADVKDMQRLADEFKALRLTLQWFMGVTAAAVVSFAVVVVQLLGR